MAEASLVTVGDLLLKLLDWPFLAFVILLFVIVLFRKQLEGVFGRGDIQISWGDRSIRLRELSGSLDEELDPIHDEIDEIKKAVAAIESTVRVPNAPRMEPRDKDALSAEQRDAAKRRMKEALASGQYLWRSIERLAIIGAVSESQAVDILRPDQDVVLSVGKSGHQIAKLATRSK